MTDLTVMITRCVRRSLRDPEAFFTSLLLPVILMLLFVYVFGGAMSAKATSTGEYADYVVPGLIVLCAGFGAGTTAVAGALTWTGPPASCGEKWAMTILATTPTETA